MLLGYFVYVALLPLVIHDRPNLRHQPLWALAGVVAGLLAVARLERYFPLAISYFRDFLPLGLTLIAFEEMTLFAPARYDGHFERAWVRWDHLLLQDWHLRAGRARSPRVMLQCTSASSCP
jgi:hypothetical protein